MKISYTLYSIFKIIAAMADTLPSRVLLNNHSLDEDEETVFLKDPQKKEVYLL